MGPREKGLTDRRILPLLRGIEHLADFDRQLVLSEGFLQEAQARIEYALAEQDILGVARHVKHLDLRSQRRQTLGQFPATHPGHHHIR